MIASKKMPSSILYPPSSCSSYRASLLGDMRFELVAVFSDKRCRRHRRGVAERADRVAHDVGADVEDQIQIASLPFAILDAVKNLFHPVTSFAARAALSARFVGVKTRDVPRCPHHAGGLVHDDDAAGTEQTPRRLDGFVIRSEEHTSELQSP